MLAECALGIKARGWNYTLRALLFEVFNSDWEYRCGAKVRQDVFSTTREYTIISAGTSRDMNYFLFDRSRSTLG